MSGKIMEGTMKITLLSCLMVHDT